MSILQRLRAFLARQPHLFNLQIEPRYVIRASGRNPYFQALERRAREAGYLGSFVVDAEGRLRLGVGEGLETLRATLALDVYPNPAVIEGRTVVDYDAADAGRRAPRATLVLDDDTELFLWPDGHGLRVAGEAVTLAVERRERH